jgi:2-keto-3-deoxy-L-rhamnonate aldolase RhmA
VRSAPAALSTSSVRARQGGNAMITVRNHAKERLDAGELALGVGLRQARTVDIARIMKTAGYDFLFIDMEHNSIKT